MLFRVIKTSETLSGEAVEIEISTLEELISFMYQNGDIIISTTLDFIKEHNKDAADLTIEIYDDYRE